MRELRLVSIDDETGNLVLAAASPLPVVAHGRHEATPDGDEAGAGSGATVTALRPLQVAAADEDADADLDETEVVATELELFVLPVDEEVRALLRERDVRHAVGLVTTAPEAPTQTLPAPVGMRPREIQARIRAGASVEEVAAVSGLPKDRVRRFADPVLSERAYVAARARAGHVRRSEGVAPALGGLVDERLVEHGGDPEHAVWDAWRREDGSWQVSVVCAVRGGRAVSGSWVFDTQARSSRALDVGARDLSDDRSRRLVRPEPGTSADSTPVLHVAREVRDAGQPITMTPRPTSLTPVGSSRPAAPERPAAERPVPVERPAAADVVPRSPAARLVALGDRRPAATVTPEAPAATDEPDAGAAAPAASGPSRSTPARRDSGRRDAGRPLVAAAPPAPEPAVADTTVAAAPAAAVEAVAAVETADNAPAAATPARRPRSGRRPVPPAETPPLPLGGIPPVAPPPARPKGRATVPAWDDIIFGNRRD